MDVFECQYNFFILHMVSKYTRSVLAAECLDLHVIFFLKKNKESLFMQFHRANSRAEKGGSRNKKLLFLGVPLEAGSKRQSADSC